MNANTPIRHETADQPLSIAPLDSIKQRREFLALRSQPRFTSPHFVLQGSLVREKDAALQAGYTVTKKTGNAVERNRIKRRLRMAVSEAFLRYEKAHGAGLERLGGKVVLVARRSALSEPYGSLVADLTKGIDRLVAKSKKAV